MELVKIATGEPITREQIEAAQACVGTGTGAAL